MSYNIFGKTIKNEYLALGTMLSTIGIAVAASSGGEKKKDTAPPPAAKDDSIKADSKDEEDFIRQFVAEAEKEGK